MVQRVLRRREVLAADGRSTSAIYAEMAAGYFPRPIPIGSRDVAWLEADIELLQAARVAERDGVLAEFIEKRKAERGTVEPWLLKIAERAADRARRPNRARRNAA